MTDPLEDMVCEQHPDRVWPHDECAGPGMPRADVEPRPTIRERAALLRWRLQWLIRIGSAPGIGDYHYLADESVDVIEQMFREIAKEAHDVDPQTPQAD